MTQGAAELNLGYGSASYKRQCKLVNRQSAHSDHLPLDEPLAVLDEW